MLKGMSQPRFLLLIGLLAAISVFAYVWMSAQLFRLGFPLDDAWIHQAYARNLGLRGEWSFLAGQPSAGSTSPIWAVMLAPAYLLQINPLIWTHFMGWIILSLLAVTGSSLFEKLAPERATWRTWVAVGLIFEWHLVWAAVSGMETLLAALLFTFVLMTMLSERLPWFWLGVLIGFCAWVRPDGVALIGPAGLVLLKNVDTRRDQLRSASLLAIGFSLVFISYLFFNLQLAGTVWPNTFYAKQAEYRVLTSLPWVRRLFDQLALPIVGAGILLVPGAFYFAWHAWISRNWARLAAVIWWLGYLGLYAWRLPVTYQHGRYLMPVMPFFFIWGAAGTTLLLERLKNTGQLIWAMQRVWLISTALTLFGFWILGSRAYALDVAFIESEMVEVAHWIRLETEPDAVLAVHDIGAIGYFSQRDLVDLAGLVSPDVIPFIRDEKRIAAYLDQRSVEYLVTFPGWYPELVSCSSLVFQSQGRYSPELGGENMAIYRWP